MLLGQLSLCLARSTSRAELLRPLRPLSIMAATSKPTVPSSAPHPWPVPQDWPAAKVRQTYIDYFVNQPGFEHTFWPSSGVIPFEDDTLLFANAVGPGFLERYDPNGSSPGHEPI